jgi:hypothetical protein
LRFRPVWRAQLWDPVTRRQRRIGGYATEEDAARAYDFAAVQAHGPVAKRNFPDEAIGELPETVRVQRKTLRGSSRLGVSWDKSKALWAVKLWDPQTKRIQHVGKRIQHVGCYASEEDAARAYDCAAVQARGSVAKRNFPDEAIGELPA